MKEFEVVVDVANLVGSTPNGWWRDRVGATERTLTWLAGLPGVELAGGRAGPVTVVLEGRAAAAHAPHGLTVLRAGRGQAGDDVIAHYAAENSERSLLVVTADRGLRARLPAEVAVCGPGVLLRVRDQLGG